MHKNIRFLVGVVALIGVVSLVNMGAIVRLTDVVYSQNENRTAYGQDLQVGHQQAAIGSLDAEIMEDPGIPCIGSGIGCYGYNQNQSCATFDTATGDVLQTGGTPVWDENGWMTDCNFPSVAGGNEGGGPYLEISHSKGGLTVSSDSPTAVIQLKLKVLGYLTGAGVTGVFDTATQNALKSFQRDNRLQQTGTYGPKTSTLIDSKVFSSDYYGNGTAKLHYQK